MCPQCLTFSSCIRSSKWLWLPELLGTVHCVICALTSKFFEGLEVERRDASISKLYRCTHGERASDTLFTCSMKSGIEGRTVMIVAIFVHVVISKRTYKNFLTRWHRISSISSIFLWRCEIKVNFFLERRGSVGMFLGIPEQRCFIFM
jgi:hypothetical protein